MLTHNAHISHSDYHPKLAVILFLKQINLKVKKKILQFLKFCEFCMEILCSRQRIFIFSKKTGHQGHLHVDGLEAPFKNDINSEILTL